MESFSICSVISPLQSTTCQSNAVDNLAVSSMPGGFVTPIDWYEAGKIYGAQIHAVGLIEAQDRICSAAKILPSQAWFVQAP